MGKKSDDKSTTVRRKKKIWRLREHPFEAGRRHIARINENRGLPPDFANSEPYPPLLEEVEVEVEELVQLPNTKQARNCRAIAEELWPDGKLPADRSGVWRSIAKVYKDRYGVDMDRVTTLRAVGLLPPG